MRWRLLLAVIGLSIADVASFAQRPPDDQRLSASRSGSDDAGFFNSTGVVQFQLIQGRLCLDAPRHRKGSQSRDEAGVYESISVTAQRGIPSLHYVYQSPDQHLTLSVQEAQAIRIESWLPKSGQRSVLDQPELGKLSWTTERGDLSEQIQAMTLLHLRATDPISFDTHYGSVIQRVLRGQSLRAISDATTLAMLNEASREAMVDVDQINQCVEQLRSSRRRLRVEAERQLLAWGTPIVPALHSISKDNLDSEQIDRLRSILARLKPSVDDTPSTLAKLLVNDREYWSKIATELGEHERQIASHHLSRFGVDPLLVSSTGNERIANAEQ